ncbi:MAG: hypothetical protein LBI04_01500 [Treponema sp.]|jgi:hypothetical protein|nr:hypothetical protein [Treponema sp.]
MRKYVILFLMAIISYSAFGQDNHKFIPLNISYFGETLVHPGFEAGYENNFYKWFNYTISIGTYVHQRHHRGFFLNGGINWRYTFPIGYSMEFGVGLGYLHTWQHGGKTYTVDDDGNVNEKTVYGHPSFMPTIKLGLLGWDLRKKTDIPMRINIDAIAFGQLPFNNYFMPHFALKTGATYYFTTPAGSN